MCFQRQQLVKLQCRPKIARKELHVLLHNVGYSAHEWKQQSHQRQTCTWSPRSLNAESQRDEYKFGGAPDSIIIQDSSLFYSPCGSTVLCGSLRTVVAFIVVDAVV